MKEVDLYPIEPGCYSVSKTGVIYSHVSNKFMNPVTDKDGYKRVKLKNIHGGFTKLGVHKVVASTFFGQEDDKIVNHIDGIKDNNSITNLEWVTNKENTHHAIGLGLINNRGSNSSSVVYSEEDVHVVCDLFEKGYSAIQVMRHFGHDTKKSNSRFYAFVNNLKRRKIWTDINSRYNY